MHRTMKSLLRIGLGVAGGIATILLVIGLFVRQPSWRASPYQLAERADPARLEAHVRFLCETVSPRNTRHPGNLDRAAAYIADALSRAGGRVMERRIAPAGPVAGTSGPGSDRRRGRC